MRRATHAFAQLLLAGLALVVADDAPAEAVPAPVAAAPAAAVPAPVAAAPAAGSGYRPQSAYTSTASYGAPHFLIMCILLVFMAAGCYEAYLRYGNPEAARKKKKKHNTRGGGYGAVTTEEEVHTYVCTHKFIHTQIHKYTNIHTCIRAHAHATNTHMHTCTRTDTDMHTYALRATWRPHHSWPSSRASWGAVPVRQARASAR